MVFWQVTCRLGWASEPLFLPFIFFMTQTQLGSNAEAHFEPPVMSNQLRVLRPGNSPFHAVVEKVPGTPAGPWVLHLALPWEGLGTVMWWPVALSTLGNLTFLQASCAHPKTGLMIEPSSHGHAYQGWLRAGTQ